MSSYASLITSAGPSPQNPLKSIRRLDMECGERSPKRSSPEGGLLEEWRDRNLALATNGDEFPSLVLGGGGPLLDVHVSGVERQWSETMDRWAQTVRIREMMLTFGTKRA